MCRRGRPGCRPRGAARKRPFYQTTLRKSPSHWHKFLIRKRFGQRVGPRGRRRKTRPDGEQALPQGAFGATNAAPGTEEDPQEPRARSSQRITSALGGPDRAKPPAVAEPITVPPCEGGMEGGSSLGHGAADQTPPTPPSQGGESTHFHGSSPCLGRRYPAPPRIRDGQELSLVQRPYPFGPGRAVKVGCRLSVAI